MNPKSLLAAIVAGLAVAGFAPPALHAQATGPKNGTVLLIRHAEKPDEGDGLTPAGEARARAYVTYFQFLKTPDGAAYKPDAIFAAADSRHSRRPRLTVEPLAQALRLPVQTPYQDKDFAALAATLRTDYAGRTVLVCWHHGAMPDLLQSLGANPAALLPGGEWPSNQYDWLLVLRYDANGHCQQAFRLVEGLSK